MTGNEKKGASKEELQKRDPTDGEEAYELIPRKRIRDEEEEKRAQLLPTKTPDGKLLYETDQAPPHRHRKVNLMSKCSEFDNCTMILLSVDVHNELL